MKYMVRFQLQAGNTKRVMELFETKGPNRNPGVQFRGAWLDTRAEVAFVLAESDDADKIEKVANSWNEFGSHEIHPVIDIEQF